MSSSQAQKEAVFNNAIVAFDALFKGSVISLALNTPPGSPSAGDIYIVASGGSGLWSGHDHSITFYFNGWQFFTPPLKLTLFDQNTAEFYTYQGGSTFWVANPSGLVAVLNDLTNVAGTPTNGQVLTYNTSTSKWGPVTPSAGALSVLTDVNVTEGSPIDGQYLMWNNGTSKWVAHAVPTYPTALTGLTDVNVTESSGIDTYLLSWHNSTGKWVAIAPTALTSLASLAGVGDVTYGSGPTIGDGLVWSGSHWAPSSSTMSYKFESLTDGPGLFAGHGGSVVMVDVSETTLDYMTLPTLASNMNASLAYAGLNDVTITSLATGQVMVWSGTKWTNQAHVDFPCGSAVVSTGTHNVDRSVGEVQRLSLTGNTTLTVSNWPASGLFGRLVLEIQNTGAFNITTWPTGTIWPGGTVPTITPGSGKKDVIILMSFDGGTTIYGSAAGQNFS
jgi:hypothetical protein